MSPSKGLKTFLLNVLGDSLVRAQRQLVLFARNDITPSATRDVRGAIFRQLPSPDLGKNGPLRQLIRLVAKVYS